MTSRRFTAIVLLAFSTCLRATPAAAGIGFWGWLQELSGPGPFTGFIITADFYCLPRDKCQTKIEGLLEEESQLVPEARTARRFVIFAAEVEPGAKSLKATPKGQFKEDTNLRTFEVISYLPLGTTIHPGRYKALDVIEAGAGVGAWRLSGPEVRDGPLWRASFPVRIRIVPAKFCAEHIRDHGSPTYRIARAISFRFGWDFVGSFSSADFVDAPPEFRPRTDWPFMRSVMFDLARFFNWP